ncbi:hypothetical protein ACVWXM_002295 [Bradyrhizobium sp. GM7.3]|jgi:hypothetical protein
MRKKLFIAASSGISTIAQLCHRPVARTASVIRVWLLSAGESRVSPLSGRAPDEQGTVMHFRAANEK